MHARYLNAIKTFEGFTPQAKWDYAQHSNGFGTKAAYPGEVITKEVAEQRFRAEIEQARRFVEKHAPNSDEGTKAALTSLTFNAGTRWVRAGLGDAVKANDLEAVRRHFLSYTKAQGEVLPGLERRRIEESAWIGQKAGEATKFAETGVNENSPTSVAQGSTKQEPRTTVKANVYGRPPDAEITSRIANSPPNTRMHLATLSAIDPLTLLAFLERRDDPKV